MKKMKMMQCICGILLCLVMALYLVPNAPVLAEESTDNQNVCSEHSYSNGICATCGYYQPAAKNNSGYYEISNAGQLYWFAAQVNAGNNRNNAILTADIIINTNVLNEEGDLNGDGSDFRAWTPICPYDNDSSTSYQGIFDGDNHAISGLYCKEADMDGVGLFGYVKGGTVQNVGIKDAYISGRNYVGGIVGTCKNGTVRNCYNAGRIIGTGNDCGGIVAYFRETVVAQCFNTGWITNDKFSSNVGGIVGDFVGSLSDCYNLGKVTSQGNSSWVGGVLGTSNSGDNEIKNCYDMGDVSSGNKIAGYSSGTFTNCYYLADSDNDGVDGTTNKTEVQFASGEVAYLLNGSKSEGIWLQTIGEQFSPGFQGGNVYPATDCQGNGTAYSNSENTTGVHVYSLATCTAPKTCTLCNETEGGALGHIMQKTDAKEATCVDGNNTYYVCSRCDKVYRDEAGQIETTVKAETLPAITDHSYSGGKCGVCGKTSEIVINMSMPYGGG